MRHQHTPLSRFGSPKAGIFRPFPGHPILLAETFVDPARFRGTCYRAAGWQFLGQTRGFAKRRPGYVAHGQPKLLLVRPLHPEARARLTAKADSSNGCAR